MKNGLTLIELILIGAMIAIVAMIFYPLIQKYADPEAYAKYQQELRKAEYDRQFPCTNGIRYIRSGEGTKTSLTPMIDPATDKPQHCTAEAP